MNPKLLIAALGLFLFSAHAFAYSGHLYVAADMEFRKSYFSNTFDGLIFSSATIAKQSGNGGSANSLGRLRFSAFINVGILYHYNFSEHTGFFTGLEVKNIGYIYKQGDDIIKRRTYNAGIPLGLKVGDMSMEKIYVFAGGGIDEVINFKEKVLKDGERFYKSKFEEYFSDRTPRFMSYIFAGVCISGSVTVKLQYYPHNFLNKDYIQNTGGPAGIIKPYAGTDVHLMLCNLNINIPYNPAPKLVMAAILVVLATAE